MYKISHELLGGLEPNLHGYITLEHGVQTHLGFGDLAQIFKVTADQNGSNFSICDGETSILITS